MTILGATAPVVWGTTYIVTTELLPAGHPMTAAVLRAVPAGLLLIALTRSWPRQWGRLVILSVLNIGAFFPLLFVAAYRLPGGLAAVVGSAQPFIAAVTAWVLFRQATPRGQLAWAGIAVFGVAMAMITGTVTLDLLGIVAATGGTIAMAVGVTLTRAWGPTQGLTGLASTGWQLLLGGIMIAPLIPLFDQETFIFDKSALVGYLWLSLVGGALAYGAWFHAARQLPAASTSLLATFSPITAAVLGWAILGQALTTLQVLGFTLALAATVLGQYRPTQPDLEIGAVPDRPPSKNASGLEGAASEASVEPAHTNAPAAAARFESLAEWLVRYEGLGTEDTAATAPPRQPQDSDPA